MNFIISVLVLVLPDISAYSNASDLRNEFRGVDPDVADFLIGMLREDPSQRKSAQELLGHAFVRRGQEHLDRLRAERATAAGRAGAQMSARNSEVETLRNKVAQLEQYKEVSKVTLKKTLLINDVISWFFPSNLSRLLPS